MWWWDEMVSAVEATRSYIDPATLSKIASLELRARTLVEGFLAGTHRSPHQGVSIEFAQHRPYVQGDPIRHVDWKVFARTDRFFLKQFSQEADLLCMLVVDASESMSYVPSGGGWTKFDYAATVAASLACLGLRQRDQVGLAVFDREIRRWIRPSRQAGNWHNIIQALSGITPQEKTGVAGVLEDIAGRLDRRSLVVLISDLFDDSERIAKALKHLRHRGHDVIVLHVLDQDELTFPFRGATRFDGLETGGCLDADPTAMRTEYLEELDRFTHALKRACVAARVDYERLGTHSALDIALSRFLAARSAGIQG